MEAARLGFSIEEYVDMCNTVYGKYSSFKAMFETPTT